MLHLTSRADAWRHWLDRAGLGIALIPRFLIAEELEKKQLTIAYNLPLKSDDAYYLVYPKENLSSSALKQFRKWLLEEVKSFQGINEIHMR